MTPKQIEDLFFQTIEEKAIYNKLEGVTENVVYNWRKGRGKKPSIGEMLNVLYQLKKIKIFKTERKIDVKIIEEIIQDSLELLSKNTVVSE